MKRINLILFLIIISLLFSCSTKKEINLEQERAAVMKVLDTFIKSHDDKSLEELMSCFSSKPDLILLGTDKNELWVDKVSMGKSQERAYKTFDKIQLSVRDKIVKMGPTGETAWFYLKVNWYVESKGKPTSFNGIRTTGVLEKEKDGWKIVQLHTSVPVQGQAVQY